MALMITGAVVFAVGAFFGAVMVAVGEQRATGITRAATRQSRT